MTTTSTFVYGDPTQLAKYGIFVSDARSRVSPTALRRTWPTPRCTSVPARTATAPSRGRRRGAQRHRLHRHQCGRPAHHFAFCGDGQCRRCIDLASEQDESAPPPQDGACPPGVTGPTAGDPHRCTVVMDNQVSANKDQGSGRRRGRALRRGRDLVAGGRNDAIVGNTVTDEGSYGIIVTIYPWTGSQPTGGSMPRGDNLSRAPLPLQRLRKRRARKHAGQQRTFGNPTNGDLADGTIPGPPGNCFLANTSRSGAVPRPPPDSNPKAVAARRLAVTHLRAARSRGGVPRTDALGPCTDGTARPSWAQSRRWPRRSTADRLASRHRESDR